MRNFQFCILLILLSCAITTVAPADESSGDEKIEDTKERIEEDVEDEEDGHHHHSKREKIVEDDEDVEGIIEAVFAILEVWGEYSIYVRYAAYPYATSSFHYNTSEKDNPEEDKGISLELSSEASWHLDNTYGQINKLAFRFSALNFELFNQTIFAGHEWFYSLSANGGLSFFVPNFAMDFYVGMFHLDFLHQVFFCFGAQVQIFFHPHLYLEVYNLNSIHKGLEFSYVSGCLSYALGRWGIGAGFNYSNFNGFAYLGPLIKISLWF